MTIAELNDLGTKVLQILQRSGGPLTIRQIENRLTEQQCGADTFDVREVVWRLVAEGRAEFDEWRAVKLPADDNS